MTITDYHEAVRTLCRVGGGTFHTTHGTFYGTLDTYEGPGDNDRHESCMTLMTDNLFDGLLYESEFISLEIPDPR